LAGTVAIHYPTMAEGSFMVEDSWEVYRLCFSFTLQSLMGFEQPF